MPIHALAKTIRRPGRVVKHRITTATPHKLCVGPSSSIDNPIKNKSMPVQYPVSPGDDSPFPIENIPFGIFSTDSDQEPRIGSIIGDHVIDVRLLAQRGEFGKDDAASGLRSALSGQTLNAFAAQPRSVRADTRARIIELLSDASSVLFADDEINSHVFIDVKLTKMHLPMQIGAFADFMCSETHHDNGNRVSGNPGIPAFHHFPLMYTGRTTSIVPSGHPIRRPKGMTSLHPPGSKNPPAYAFAASTKFDFELEMGLLVANPIPLGTRITAADADAHIFGLVLLNDWSARDVQFAEMIPMGPSNGKASGTTLSPWVVMPEALAGARSELSSERARVEMQSHPAHLQHAGPNTWDVRLEATVKGKGEEVATTLCRSNLRDAYWSPGQMLAHYASSGCGVRTGDLLGTGTASSPGHTIEAPTLGCLFELTLGGKEPFALVGGRKLRWLEDGDEVVLKGWTTGKGGKRIGFGEAAGVLLAAEE